MACHFENMKSGVCPIDDIDIAAVVGFHIVALDSDLAGILAIDFDATLVRRCRNRWDEIAHFLGMIGVLDVDGSDPSVKPSDKSEFPEENRRHALVGRMRSEPAAALAEFPA